MKRLLGSMLVLFALPVDAATVSAEPFPQSSTPDAVNAFVVPASVVPAFVVPLAGFVATDPLFFRFDCGAPATASMVLSPCGPFSDESHGAVATRLDPVKTIAVVDAPPVRQTVDEPFVPVLLVIGAFAFFSERRHQKARQRRC